MLATSEKIFSPPGNQAGRRSRVGLEFDQQIIATVDSWARRRGLTFAAVMDQAARQIAERISRDQFFAAQQLRFDRSIQILDLKISIPDLDQSLSTTIDRSIRRENRFACGNLTARQEKRQADLRWVGAEGERAQEALEFYAALTGNRIKPNDSRAFAKVSHFSDFMIQAGILHAFNCSTRPIGSFAYCVKAIENFRDYNGEQLQEVVGSLRKKIIAKLKRGQILLPLEGEKLLIGEFQNRELKL